MQSVWRSQFTQRAIFSQETSGTLSWVLSPSEETVSWPFVWFIMQNSKLKTKLFNATTLLMLYTKQHDHPSHISRFEHDSWQLTDQRFLRVSQRGLVVLGFKFREALATVMRTAPCTVQLILSFLRNMKRQAENNPTPNKWWRFRACNVFFIYLFFAMTQQETRHFSE